LRIVLVSLNQAPKARWQQALAAVVQTLAD
jgi:hypothetical protein